MLGLVQGKGEVNWCHVKGEGLDDVGVSVREIVLKGEYKLVKIKFRINELGILCFQSLCYKW